MLRSWIDRVTTPRASFESLGVFLAKRHITTVEVSRRVSGNVLSFFEQSSLDVPLFAGTPTVRVISELDKALGVLAKQIKNRYVPIHVSLPDPAVQVAILELDELPSANEAQIELATWRLSQEYGTEVAHVCAIQPMGVASGKHLLFVLGLEKSWHECIIDAFRRANVVPWSLSADVCRHFNRFHDRIAADPGALGVISAESWTLWLWDDLGRPRFHRSRWRSSGDSHMEIVSDMQRAILAYTQRFSGRSVDRVYIVADETEKSFPTLLNTRLNDACTMLDVTESIAIDQAIKMVPVGFSGSVSAAINQ